MNTQETVKDVRSSSTDLNFNHPQFHSAFSKNLFNKGYNDLSFKWNFVPQENDVWIYSEVDPYFTFFLTRKGRVSKITKGKIEEEYKWSEFFRIVDEADFTCFRKIQI